MAFKLSQIFVKSEFFRKILANRKPNAVLVRFRKAGKPDQQLKEVSHEEMVHARKKMLVLGLSSECSRICCVHISSARKIVGVDVVHPAWVL